MTARESIQDLQTRMSGDIIGQEYIVERLVIALLANGNVLVEALPGLAKTRAVKSLARHLATDFSRIHECYAVSECVRYVNFRGTCFGPLLNFHAFL